MRIAGVDVPCTRKEGRFRVVSGTASQSLLHQILAEGDEDILHYNHTEVLSSQFKNDVASVRTFIDDWINDLKKTYTPTPIAGNERH